MAAVPLQTFPNSPGTQQSPTALATKGNDTQDWTSIAAAAAVVGGGVLMVTGHKRAGLAVAAVGTMIALLDEPETIDSWWKNLPEYLKGAQEMLDKAEGYLNEAGIQGRRLQSLLHRSS